MSQLKEIDGRYYQEHEVVMLAINNNSNIGKRKLNSNPPLFSQFIGWYPNINLDFFEAQHIYILSNEEIKEDDWCHDKTPNEEGIIVDLIYQKKIGIQYKDTSTERKIIATTDELLGNMIPYLKIGKAMKGNWKSLPKPSYSFIKKYIEEYNKGNIITNVLVEYVDNGEEDWIGDDYDGEPFWDSKLEIKVDSNNQITIKKVKDTYTQKEVEQHILNVFRDIYPDRHWESKGWDWIKQNL